MCLSTKVAHLDDSRNFFIGFYILISHRIKVSDTRNDTRRA